MRVLVTGSGGMVGGAICRALAAADTTDVLRPTRATLDLADARATHEYVVDAGPDVVVHCAARVGGIQANMADLMGFMLDNAAIDASIIRASLDAGVRRLVYMGSSCMYPRDLGRPLREEDILTAPLEPTNEGYALAKIMGSRACTFASRQHGIAYRTIIPPNLYGPGDSYDPARSHLIAAVLRKIHDAHTSGAESVEIWGDGTARREFLFVDDLAHFVVSRLDDLGELPDVLNVGAGSDHSVREYYETVASVIGYSGAFEYDTSRPTGMKQKLMDSARAAALGWAPSTSLRDGLTIALRDLEESLA